MHFSHFKNLLHLSDEALELADRHGLEEGVLRHVLQLPSESQSEMVQQIITFSLSGRQVREIVEQHQIGDTENDTEKPSPHAMRLIKLMRTVDEETPNALVQTLLREERNVHLARARIETMIAFLQEANHLLGEQ